MPPPPASIQAVNPATKKLETFSFKGSAFGKWIYESDVDGRQILVDTGMPT